MLKNFPFKFNHIAQKKKQPYHREIESREGETRNREIHMAEQLQRSVTSFRRQGSSGSVWDDKFLAGLWDQNQNQNQNQDQHQNQNQEGAKANQNQQESQREQREPESVGFGSSATLERSRSGGARPYRTVNVATPSKDPPSPKVAACGLCGFFGKPASAATHKSKKRRWWGDNSPTCKFVLLIWLSLIVCPCSILCFWFGIIIICKFLGYMNVSGCVISLLNFIWTRSWVPRTQYFYLLVLHNSNFTERHN